MEEIRQIIYEYKKNVDRDRGTWRANEREKERGRMREPSKEEKRKKKKEEGAGGALRYSRASDSPRASTCSTCARRFKISSLAPLPPLLRAFDGPRIYSRAVSRSRLPERRPTLRSVLVPRTVAAPVPPRRARSRPRLSHRYSRGLLGARGKMRQVVVRSRRVRERERYALLFSLSSSVRLSVHPSRPPPARQRHSFVRVILCARVSGACVSGAPPPRLGAPQAPWARRAEAGTYFCPMTEAERDQLTNAPLTMASGYD